MFEPEHNKTNKMIYAPNKDADQPGHPLMQSDQSLHCPPKEALGPLLPKAHAAKTLTVSLLGAHVIFIRFAVHGLMYVFYVFAGGD